MTVTNLTITNTYECVKQLCDRTNDNVGCHLQYSNAVDSKHVIEDREGYWVAIGTAEELVHMVAGYAGGFMAGQRETSKAPQ